VVRYSKVQISKIAAYWAILAFSFSLFWSIVLNSLKLTGVGPALTLVFPGIVSLILALAIYYRRQHQRLEYDDLGYSVVRGNGTAEHHDWSEFNECSVIRDRYDKRRVRLYLERDGNSLEVDTTASGLDPYRFRNFALERIQRRRQIELGESDAASLYDSLEREIHRRTNFIADFNETFRHYDLSDEDFQLVARGSTRPRGFIFSKVFAVTVLPDYHVCLYALDLDAEKGKSRAMRLVRLIESVGDEKNIKWSWLLFFSRKEPSDDLKLYIEHFGNKQVGLGCIDISTGNMISSQNQLGRSFQKQMRLNRFVRGLSKSSGKR
jgi:hypothetical protein